MQDLVITGSLASHRNGVPPGDHVGNSDGIGEVRVTFAEPPDGAGPGTSTLG
jgi:hypothetical protein